jgi:hypothetical protein
LDDISVFPNIYIKFATLKKPGLIIMETEIITMKKNEYKYVVAEMPFGIHIDVSDELNDHLQQYEPFLTLDKTLDMAFFLNVFPPDGLENFESYGSQIADFNEEGQRMQIYKSNDGEYSILMALDYDEAGCCLLTINKNFSQAWLRTTGSSQMRFYGFNSAMMMMYAFAGSTRHNLLIHSSVIRKNGCGYLFLGKSGTGKSTHSGLWLKYIPDAELLNDDNPVLRFGDDEIPMVYGSPWSGKTPCYRNIKARIGGFVSLNQASFNKIQRLPIVSAYAVLLPAISNMKWERQLNDGINETINSIISKIPIFRLDCLPDEAAANMSYRELTAYIKNE